MRYSKWIGLVAAIVLVYLCFTPWVIIASKGITITGVDATDTSFGKPGYAHLLLTAFFLFFNFVPRVWAKRTNLLIVALNLAWAIRNYFVLSACRAGDCPDKQPAIYILVVVTLLMLITALFPDMKLPQQKER